MAIALIALLPGEGEGGSPALTFRILYDILKAFFISKTYENVSVYLLTGHGLFFRGFYTLTRPVL